MLAVVLALGAAAAYGTGDFLGGLASRRIRVLTVLALSQAAGFLAVLVWALLSADAFPPAETVAVAAAAGICGAVGLAALYRGFAVGAIGIVAPISATAPLVAVSVDVARGDSPSPLQLAGLVLALCGIALASREPVEGGARLAAGAGLAVVAALAFGTYFVGLDAAADESVPWAVACARGASSVLTLAAVAATRSTLRPGRALLPLIAAVGLFDTAGNVLLAAASVEGLLTVVAVLSSLYPIVTIGLAHLVLHDRVAPVQWLGGAGALGGAALLASG